MSLQELALDLTEVFYGSVLGLNPPDSVGFRRLLINFLNSLS